MFVNILCKVNLIILDAVNPFLTEYIVDVAQNLWHIINYVIYRLFVLCNKDNLVTEFRSFNVVVTHLKTYLHSRVALSCLTNNDGRV